MTQKTQKRFLKATGALLERLVWALLMTLWVMVKLVFRVVTNGTPTRQSDQADRVDPDPYHTSAMSGDVSSPHYLLHHDSDRE